MPGPAPAANDQAAATEAWTRLWRAGALHSCGCAFRGNYEGAIADFWRAQFAALRAGARVVDLGTGNGALLLLARAAGDAAGRPFALHGVDLADIDPAAGPDGTRRYAGIRFHPRTSMAALPFADRSVELACGQYALEYAPFEAAAREIARVLAPDGRIAFVLHARDSLLLDTTRDQLASCAVLFEHSRLFEHARRLAARLAVAATPEARRALAADPGAQADRERLNVAVGQVAERIASARTPDLLQDALKAVRDALAGAHRRGVAGTDQCLVECATALAGERDRLRDLDRAALDRDQLDAQVDRWASLGLVDLQIDALDHAPGRKLGWTLVGRRG